jgi:hypothetical protein
VAPSLGSTGPSVPWSTLTASGGRAGAGLPCSSTTKPCSRTGLSQLGASPGATIRTRANEAVGSGSSCVLLRPARSTVVTWALETPGGASTGTLATPSAPAVTGPKEALPIETRTRARGVACTRSTCRP